MVLSNHLIDFVLKDGIEYARPNVRIAVRILNALFFNMGSAKESIKYRASNGRAEKETSCRLTCEVMV